MRLSNAVTRIEGWGEVALGGLATGGGITGAILGHPWTGGVVGLLGAAAVVAGMALVKTADSDSANANKLSAAQQESTKLQGDLKKDTFQP
jgi:hypothetical protein